MQDNRENFMPQFELVLQCLPMITDEDCFVLKGGTAINLFVRNFPRISVDIDLYYQPIENREDSLRNISSALDRIAERINLQKIDGNQMLAGRRNQAMLYKINVKLNFSDIKIEVSPVMRGSVYAHKQLKLMPNVPNGDKNFSMNVASEPDLYAGKFMAALDRQHPRDLFDVHEFFQNSQITEELRNAFLVYFISGKRSPVDTLAPNRKDMGAVFQTGLVGLMINHVTLDELELAREQLITEIVGNMPDKHREFILTFFKGKPNWSLLDVPNVELLPAVRWRMINLEKISPEKRTDLLNGIESAFLEADRNKTQ